jgi:transcriptional regulator with XRE-family HTH domain
MEAYYKKVGKRLRSAREKAKLSQEDVAQKINSTNQRVSSFETGRTRVSLEILIRLCKIYRVEPDYIMGMAKNRGTEFSLNEKHEEVIFLFRRLRPDFQDCALEQIRALTELQNKKTIAGC